MKKHLQILMLLAALLVPWASSAQQVVTIGTGTTTSSNVPTHNYYKYSFTQQIYTAEEIGTACSISSLAFKNTGAEKTRTISIYMALTDKLAFSSTTDWVSTSASDMVYTGTVTFTSGQWTTIQLSTPFVYDGSSNLLISVSDNTGAYTSTPHMACLTFSATNQALYKNQDTPGAINPTNPNVTGTRSSSKNQIQLGITPIVISCNGVRSLRIVNSETTSTSMTLRWVDTNNTSATYTIVNMADNSVIASGLEDTFYTINTLTANTTYTFGVYAKCAADDSSRIATVSGRTPCEAIATSQLPYSYGFEDAPSSGATYPINACWTKGTNNTTAYPYPFNTYKHSGIYSLIMNATASNYSYAAMPAFEEDINNLYVTFWGYKTAAASGQVVVGVMSDPEDITTFDTVAELYVNALSTWEMFDVDLSTYTGNGRYIAFYTPKGTANTVYIDDITVMETPSCIRPQVVRVEGIGDVTATISWSPSVSGPTDYTILYKGTTDFDPETATGVLSESTIDTIITLTGLTPQTVYYVKVSANCADNSSMWSQTSLKTRCAAETTLPYTYGFEDASGTSSTSTINACWSKGTNNTSTAYPYPSGTYKHSGSKSLYMNATASYYCYAAMPAFVQSVNSLLVSFWGYKTTAASGKIIVGVMSNPDDISTFDTVTELFVPATSTWKEFNVPLVNYTGTGRYIAFFTPAGASNTVYIDDITVDLAPTCLLPENLHLASVSTNAATLEWTPAGSFTAFNVKYDTISFNPATSTDAMSEEVTANSISLTELLPNQTYFVSLQTDCGDDTTEWSDLFSFTTLCEAVSELPWFFDPDSLSATTTATDIECFEHIGGGYVNIATRTGFTGNTVRFYPNSSTKPNILVLPDFEDPISSLYMTFKTAPEGSTSGSISVGYITNVTDSTTFVALGTYPVSSFNATGSIVPQVLDMTFADAPAGARIAFRHNVNSTSYYWFLDEITVIEMPTCVPPESVTATFQGSTATLNMVSSGSSEYIIVLDAPIDTTVSVYGDTYDLEDLVGGMSYSGRVYSYCDGDTSFASTSFSFTMPCQPIADMPWNEGFNTITNINQLLCWDRYAGLYNDTAAFTLTTTTSGWGLYSDHGMDGSQHVKVNIYGTGAKYWIVTPPFEIGSEMSMTFDYSLTTYNSDAPMDADVTDDRFIVFAITEDTSFVPLGKWGSNTTRDDYSYAAIPATPTHMRFDLDDFDGQAVRFAFYGESTVSGDDNDLHIDNIFVGVVPECPRPDSVQIEDITFNSATIRWVDTNEVGSYAVTYWPEGENLTANDTITVYESNTEVVLENLEPDSIYYIIVQSDCGDLSLPTNTRTFRTACTPVAGDDMPYVENFDTYGTGSSAAISTCWKKGVSGSTTRYPYPNSTGAITGGACLYFYGTSSITSYAAMPLFETSINDLMLSFSIKRPTTATYKTILLVGVMSDPTDITTFDTVETIDLSNEPVSSIHRILVSLENYEGEGRYIAFKSANTTSTSTYNYVYLDSVVVDSLPACRWPSALVADSVTDSSVYLSWTGSGENFYVEASLSDDFSTVAAYAEATETWAVVTGLNNYSQYYFRVRTVCDDTVSFWSNIATAITDVSCGAGYETAFDTISYGTSTSYSYILNGYSSYSNTASWHIYTPAELDGLGMMDTINYIRGISIEAGSVSNTPISFRVYMGTTDLDEWHSATSATSTTGLNDTLPISSMQLVYDGSITFEANTWNEIAFSTPYLYRAEENLVVAFVRDATITGTTYFKYGTISNFRSAYKYTSGSSSYAYRGKYGANMTFITCNHIPTCPKPRDVVASNVATDGFDLAWVGSSAGYKVVVATASIDPDSAVASDSVFIYTPATNSLTVTGLAPQTTYYYYLRSECGDEQSSWTREASVMTMCEAQTIPYYENFDGMAAFSHGDDAAAELPCYDVLSANANSYVALYNTSTYRYGNTGYTLKFRSGDANVANILILPEFTEPISGLELTFQTRPEGTNANTGVFDVGYITDINNDSTFVVTDHYVYSEFSGAYKQKTVYFTGAPAGARIAMRHTPTSNNWFWFVDEIDVHEAPTCFPPDSVSVSNTTQNSAIVRWVDHRNDSTCSYEVEYGTPGFAHGTGISQIVSADSIVLTGLNNSNYYEVYVRTVCSATDITNWTDGVTFHTLCGPISLPYSNDWESESTGSSNMALCWNRFYNAGSTAYPYIYASNGHNGSKSLYFYMYNYSTYANDEAYISPAIDTANYPINNIEVSFWAKSTVAGKHIMVGVMSGTDNMSTFTMIDTIALTTTYTEYFVNTAAYTGNGNHIAFRVIMENLASSSNYSIYVDEVVIDQLPPCPRVYNLAAAGSTQNSAVLSWTDTIGSTSWIVEYKQAGVQGATVNTVTANSNPFTLTGLTPATRYSYRVAPVCSTGDTSFFSRESCIFATSQVPATMPYSYNFENAAEWANWQTASNNNVNWYRDTLAIGDSSYAMYLSADGGATNSWRRNTITNVAAYRDIDFGTDTNSYEVTFRYHGGGHNTSVSDGISVLLVDPSILVDIPNTYLGSPWGTIHWVHARRDSIWDSHTVSLDGVSGVKRLVFYHFNNAATDASTYMDIPPAIDDITIEVQECARPYDLTVNNVTPSSATLSWTGEDTLNYVIEYQVGSTTPQYQAVLGNSYTLTGLASNTTYKWWVRKVCELTATDTVLSSWSSQGTFTTLCGYAELPYFEGFQGVTDSVNYSTAGVLPDCWARYSNGTDSKYLPHVTGQGTYHYPHNSTKCLTMTSGGSTYGDTKVAVMPPFAVPLSSLHLNFWYRMESASSGTFTVGYVTNLDDLAGSFVPVKSISNTTTVSQDSVTFENAPANALQIAFRWQYNSSYFSMSIDDINVWTDAPTCDAPDSINFTTTYNSAELTWSNVADSFEVYIRQGDWVEPLIGTGLDTNSISITGLTPNTPYAFGVRSVCDEGLVSDWNVTYFSTAVLPCFTPENLRVSDENYTSAIVTFTPGLQQSRWQLHLFRQGFDRYEYVTDSTYTFEGLTYNQSYQVAVRAICGANDTSDWSDTVLFSTLNCNTVTGVNVDQIMATTAHVTWESTGAASYIVAYGYQGFNQGEGTEVPTENNYYTIEGLEPNTMYDVMVSAVCTDGVSSLWSARFTFSTQAGTGTYYTISVYSNNTAWGTVSGGGTYEAGSVRQITATPTSDQYRFVKWDDENTDNPRTITVNADATYTALFAENVGIEEAEMSEVSLFPNPATSTVSIRANGMEQVTLIDLNGSIVMTQRVSDETVTFDVSNLAKGAYFVRITGGNGTAVRKLIVK